MKYYISCLLAILLLASCGNAKKEDHAASTAPNDTAASEQLVRISEQQRAGAGISLGYPALENIGGTITLQGSVEVPPQNTIRLSFPVSGYIKSTTMLPGKAVRKGQVLALIEDMQLIQLQQDYLTATANATLADAEFERQQELNASKASSDKVFQQAKAERDRQRILISALQQKLRLIGIDPARLSPETLRKSVPITAPIDGFVAKVNVAVGQYTAPTDVLFELVDPSDIHLALQVFEKDIARIETGSPVIAYTNADPGRSFGAKVILTGRSFDANRTTTIHCHFDKYDPALIPGMFMNAAITVKAAESLVVPEQSVVRWHNRHYVFVASGTDQFLMTEVKPGMLHKGLQQIEAQGIDQHTKIVTGNAFALLMKLKNTEG
ncbi:MAG TPA: efflux RND transporter periplasmic adaptor subunit [Chitinophagaceae bacterium]|nr:efflux RND transporter periplasmic adaptor subunit [Chitinophagaceae bacterium]